MLEKYHDLVSLRYGKRWRNKLLECECRGSLKAQWRFAGDQDHFGKFGHARTIRASEVHMPCRSEFTDTPASGTSAGATNTPEGFGQVLKERSQACSGFSQIRASLKAIRTPLMIVALAALPATADPLSKGPGDPDPADLTYYFRCSDMAATRALSFEEASACTRTFLRIKLSFVPGVCLEDFQRLAPQERAAVNTFAYKRYLDWSSENSAEIEALKNAPLTNSAFAEY